MILVLLADSSLGLGNYRGPDRVFSLLSSQEGPGQQPGAGYLEDCLWESEKPHRPQPCPGTGTATASRGYIAFISFGGGGLNVHMLTCINLSLYQHKRHSQRQGVSFAFWVFNCFFCCCCLFCFVLQGEGVSTRVWTQGLLLVDRHSTT
jgi:hypothetical protein